VLMLRAEADVLCRVLGLVRVSRQAWGGVGEAVSREVAVQRLSR
jgi:hypothetical protein